MNPQKETPFVSTVSVASHRAGFTILEAVAMVAIVAILAVFTIPNYKSWLAKASEAKCMANMRSIHLALGTHLNDHENKWPQGPSPLEGVPWAEFWIRVLEPQGITPQTWECPAIYRMMGNPPRDKVTSESIHYMPTMFDDKPGTARLWPTQPWLIERADAHGNGALICFTDGSIKPFNKVLAELGYR